MTSLLCTPSDLQQALALGEGQAIDVREPAEIATERIPGLRPLPLSAFDRMAPGLDRQRPVYVVCRSGKRAADAATRLAGLGHSGVRVLEGGLRAWVAAGLPVEKGASGVWSLERQVRFAAGALVVTGASLAALVHPGFVALSGFVGAGLMFAGATDSCGMAMVLARMPWNQRAAPSCVVPDAR